LEYCAKVCQIADEKAGHLRPAFRLGEVKLLVLVLLAGLLIILSALLTTLLAALMLATLLTTLVALLILLPTLVLAALVLLCHFYFLTSGLVVSFNGIAATCVPGSLIKSLLRCDGSTCLSHAYCAPSSMPHFFSPSGRRYQCSPRTGSLSTGYLDR